MNYVQAHHAEHVARWHDGGKEARHGAHVRAGDLDIWVEQVGEGPDVLLLGGLATPSSRGSSSSTEWPTAIG